METTAAIKTSIDACAQIEKISYEHTVRKIEDNRAYQHQYHSQIPDINQAIEDIKDYIQVIRHDRFAGQEDGINIILLGTDDRIQSQSHSRVAADEKHPLRRHVHLGQMLFRNFAEAMTAADNYIERQAASNEEKTSKFFTGFLLLPRWDGDKVGFYQWGAVNVPWRMVEEWLPHPWIGHL